MRPPNVLWSESEADSDDERELDDMSYVEKYVFGDEIPVAQIIGIDRDHLPPFGTGFACDGYIFSGSGLILLTVTVHTGLSKKL